MNHLKNIINYYLAIFLIISFWMISCGDRMPLEERDIKIDVRLNSIDAPQGQTVIIAMSSYFSEPGGNGAPSATLTFLSDPMVASFKCLTNEKQFSLKVVGASGSTLPGSRVFIENLCISGCINSVVSDSEGGFSLETPAGNGQILVLYSQTGGTGYVNSTTAVSSGSGS